MQGVMMSAERFAELESDDHNWEDDTDLIYELYDALCAERAAARALAHQVLVLCATELAKPAACEDIARYASSHNSGTVVYANAAEYLSETEANADD